MWLIPEADGSLLIRHGILTIDMKMEKKRNPLLRATNITDYPCRNFPINTIRWAASGNLAGLNLGANGVITSIALESKDGLL